ncbi:hypothetical protein [Shouchella patagoniensis]|uniref:hypothetical protein n=1 Tax=Shouchella patagoniensis TaxID=228576 RepID=UPI000994D384|nr:hypothetical protein [Shouchella patagoniensis]
MKQVLFAVGALAFCLAGCGQDERISFSEDDMVATNGTITDVEFEGDYEANVGSNVFSTATDEKLEITSLGVDSDPEVNVLLNRRTEVYVKHLKDYLRVNQSYLKPELDVVVYGELADTNGAEETVATKIVIQAKDRSIKGVISNTNEERSTFFLLGEDGHYESGTRFSYDPATELLSISENDDLEIYEEDLQSGLIVEVFPRGAVEEGVPSSADAARVIIQEEEEAEAFLEDEETAEDLAEIIEEDKESAKSE